MAAPPAWQAGSPLGTVISPAIDAATAGLISKLIMVYPQMIELPT
jgi:hypothetical protein